jgi:hypothetical protein
MDDKENLKVSIKVSNFCQKKHFCFDKENLEKKKRTGLSEIVQMKRFKKNSDKMHFKVPGHLAE